MGVVMMILMYVTVMMDFEREVVRGFAFANQWHLVSPRLYVVRGFR